MYLALVLLLLLDDLPLIAIKIMYLTHRTVHASIEREEEEREREREEREKERERERTGERGERERGERERTIRENFEVKTFVSQY
jgi:cell division protein FtsL